MFQISKNNCLNFAFLTTKRKSMKISLILGKFYLDSHISDLHRKENVRLLEYRNLFKENSRDPRVEQKCVKFQLREINWKLMDILIIIETKICKVHIFQINSLLSSADGISYPKREKMLKNFNHKKLKLKSMIIIGTNNPKMRVDKRN